MTREKELKLQKLIQPLVEQIVKESQAGKKSNIAKSKLKETEDRSVQDLMDDYEKDFIYDYEKSCEETIKNFISSVKEIELPETGIPESSWPTMLKKLASEMIKVETEVIRKYFK